MIRIAPLRCAALALILASAAQAADLVASSTAPTVTLTDTDGAVGSKAMVLKYDAAGYQVAAATDAGAASHTGYRMARSATGVQTHEFYAGGSTTAALTVNAVGQTVVGKGTAALPGLVGLGETDAGMSWPTTSDLGLSAVGKERLRIGAYLIYNRNDAVATGAFSASLAAILPMQMYGRDGYANGMAADAFGGSVYFTGRRANGTAAAPLPLAANDLITLIEGRGWYQTGTASGMTTAARASMRLYASEAWSSTAQGTLFRFDVTPNGTTAAVPAGRIDNAGALSWGGNWDSLATYAASTVRPMIQTSGSSTNAAAIGIARFSANDLPPALHLAKGRSNTVGTHTAVLANDQLGVITAGGADGTDMATAAQILFEADGTVAANQVPGRIRLITASSTGAQVEALRVTKDGNVGIGMTTPSNKLEVNGTIRAKEVIVETTGNWADHVFAADYQLRPLPEVAAYIAEHQHLPDVPAAATLNDKGLPLSEMSRVQMQKIEELTLYVLKLEADKAALEQRLSHDKAALEARMTALEARMAK